MKTLINTYLSDTGIKQITSQSKSQTPSMEDRVTFDDHFGSRLQMDVAALYHALYVLASSHKMSLFEYLEKLTTLPASN
jgi:hypothetical protein